MEEISIIFGLTAIIFRKKITEFQNRIQPGISGKVSKKTDKKTVKKFEKKIVKIQEIFIAIIGIVFVITGVISQLGFFQ
ncbi:hypothetical protein ACFL5V_01855 [Fibrobacterota bacterium]